MLSEEADFSRVCLRTWFSTLLVYSSSSYSVLPPHRRGGGEVRVGVVVGILWNAVNRVALWISRVAPWRTSLCVVHPIVKIGPRLGMAIHQSIHSSNNQKHPHNRRDPKPRRDRQTGNKKKNARSATIRRKNGAQMSHMGSFGKVGEHVVFAGRWKRLQAQHTEKRLIRQRALFKQCCIAERTS